MATYYRFASGEPLILGTSGFHLTSDKGYAYRTTCMYITYMTDRIQKFRNA